MAILRNLWEDRRREKRPVINVPFTQEVTMGSEEREKHGRADGEPDVEAHMKHKAVEDAKPEPEDREDDGPDVEAHMKHK
jgi:hypothetical protein